MTENEMAESIKYFLKGGSDGSGEPFMAVELEEEPSRGTLVNVRTFREAGLPTKNAGIIISLPGGAEYQVTIVKSRG